MDAQALQSWLEGYLRAWSSNEPDDIAELFTEDAAYYTAPFREPWSGRDAIVGGWIGRRDEPGTYDFRHEILAVTDEIGFV